MIYINVINSFTLIQIYVTHCYIWYYINLTMTLCIKLILPVYQLATKNKSIKLSVWKVRCYNHYICMKCIQFIWDWNFCFFHQANHALRHEGMFYTVPEEDSSKYYSNVHPRTLKIVCINLSSLCLFAFQYKAIYFWD